VGLGDQSPTAVYQPAQGHGLLACMMHISFIICPGDKTDMYSHTVSQQPSGLGVHIRQITWAHDTTITWMKGVVPGTQYAVSDTGYVDTELL